MIAALSALICAVSLVTIKYDREARMEKDMNTLALKKSGERTVIGKHDKHLVAFLNKPGENPFETAARTVKIRRIVDRENSHGDRSGELSSA